MATRLTHDLTYDAPMAAVGAMLRDPAFREEVCDAMGVLRSEATVEPQGGDGADTVVIDQVQTATGLPGFAKKFVGDEIHIVQTETWTGLDHADVEVLIPGKPGHMRGTADLTESGGTTTEHVDLEIKVSIPLVAGKIESLIADMLRKALQAENATGRTYLSRQG